jgi:hypothetical protein
MFIFADGPDKRLAKMAKWVFSGTKEDFDELLPENASYRLKDWIQLLRPSASGWTRTPG